MRRFPWKRGMFRKRSRKVPKGKADGRSWERKRRRRAINFRILSPCSMKGVKYWITFNEINSLLRQPFMSGAICTPKGELSPSDLYQAMHHELTASALAVKLAHETDPAYKIGCMVVGITIYPLTPNPDDILKVMDLDNDMYFFLDIHCRGA
ncbi:MAG: family 1 glycosylhydrolase, partial [Selenomonadaceae bacterium]|nr:family 1 glycosylhydrolase [Selenomonadaceae bacterium]